MLLYFNMLYSVVWATFFPLLLQWKFGNWEPPIYISILTPLFFVAWLIVEPLRLTLGYLGNLSERVEWLGPFLVLTVVPQIVVHFYFAVGQFYAGWITLDIEVVFNIIFFIFYVAEIVIGWRTTTRFGYKTISDELGLTQIQQR